MKLVHQKRSIDDRLSVVHFTNSMLWGGVEEHICGLLRNLSQLRWLIIAQTGTTILQPLLSVMVFWMTGIFVSWGMFSRVNAISVTTFLVAAMCVSAAIFLILELYSPYSGFLRISSTPLRIAYDSLAR